MKRFIVFSYLTLIGLFGFSQVDTVVFSASGGFYDDVFQIYLSNNFSQNHIRYTINGNRPTAHSQIYTSPILLNEQMYSKSDIYTIVNCPEDDFYLPDNINHCIVIRAAVFDANDSCVSDVVTNSYFIKALNCDTHGLPVVSICADSLDLFDYNTGIFVPGVHFKPSDPKWTGNYYQTGIEWERLMNIEFYERNNKGINQQAGLRTHGGNGRRFQQKCLKIYAREDYGKKRFKHQFFETISNKSFKHLTLKPMASAWSQAGVQDHLCSLITSHGFDFEHMASRPVVLYINGEYWGIYFIHEKPDERFLEDHYDVDIDNVNIIGNYYGVVEYGSNTDFIAFMNWLENADLANSADYEYVDNTIDISCFIDYQIFELFGANKDWPSNNMKVWQSDNGKWRWFFYDGDACFKSMTFDVFANATYVGDQSWPASTHSTLLFRKLLENTDFKNAFIDRFNELLNSRLKYSELSIYLTYTENAIEDEISYQSDRFAYPKSVSTWRNDMDKLDTFLSDRNKNMREKIDAFFSGVDEINVENQYMLFPNPATDFVYVKGDYVAYEIYDIMGHRVLSEKNISTNMEEICITNLESGIYMIRFLTKNDKIVTKKFIK